MLSELLAVAISYFFPLKDKMNSTMILKKFDNIQIFSSWIRIRKNIKNITSSWINNFNYEGTSFWGIGFHDKSCVLNLWDSELILFWTRRAREFCFGCAIRNKWQFWRPFLFKLFETRGLFIFAISVSQKFIR